LTYLFTEINQNRISIVLSILTVFITFHVIIGFVEYNLAFSSFYENPMVPIPISEAEFLTYDDIVSGFSIKYPPGWERAQNVDKSVTFLVPKENNSDIHPAGLGIMFKEIVSNMTNTTLASITQTQLSTLKNLYPDIKILESIETTFLGHPAHKIIFTATDNTQNMRKAMQIWFKEETKKYLMTYKSDNERFSKYLPTIDKMLNSFYTYKN
jgi:eukaryotic-like serine/threonine-protein kinase